MKLHDPTTDKQDHNRQSDQKLLPPYSPNNRVNERGGYFKSIRNKMIFSLLVIYLLGSLSALMALFSLSFMDKKTAVIESFYELNQLILETRRYEKNFLLYGNVTDLMSALDYLEKTQSSLELLQANRSFPTVVARKLPESISQLKVFADLLHDLAKTNPKTLDKQSHYEKIRQQGHLITKTILLMDNQARMAMEKSAQGTRNLSLLLLASTMFFGGVLSFLFGRWVIEPLGFIRKAVTRVIVGELTEIPITSRMEQFSECRDLIFSLNKLLYALKVKQEQLVQSTKLAAIGEVTAGIAHEINNPLNNIFLTAEVILEEIKEMPIEEQTELVKDIVDQADRAREVVRHLLDFSKAHKPSKWEQFDVVKLLEGTLSLLKNQIALNQITVEKKYAETAVSILGHTNLLQQVFVNIILNAIQSMGRSGTLTLGVKIESSKVIIEIEDNGPGIPDDIKSHIFDPFFTTKDVGTGLGLSVCYAIVNEHHGDIVLSSEEGQGACFKIVLPLIKNIESDEKSQHEK